MQLGIIQQRRSLKESQAPCILINDILYSFQAAVISQQLWI
jgi:hypothetical protein